MPMKRLKLKIKEKFSWLTPEAFKIQDIGKNTVRIKGIALKADALSRNQRYYVEEELIKSARTLIGKPITINHDPQRIVGHVEWAEYEDGFLEYYGVVKKQPYVQMLREGDPRIQGVSVEAIYLHNVCPKCGEKFYTEEEFLRHMTEVHHVKDIVSEPHGIKFEALSLVVAPEIPGVPGTTVELAETYQPLSRLLETVTKVKKEEIEWRKKMSKAPVAVTQENRTTIDKIKEQAEQQPKEEHQCPEGQHWDEEAQACVPDTPKTTATEKLEKALEAEYPWDQCIRDRLADGYTEEQAKRICAAIKNRTVKHTMEFYGYKTVKEAIDHIVKKIEEDKLFAYNLDRFAEQLERGPPPAQTVEAPAPCPEGFVYDEESGTCIPKEWPEETPPSPAPQITPQPTIDIPKTDVSIPAPSKTEGPVLEQQQFPTCPEGSHYDPESGTCVPDTPVPTEVTVLAKETRLFPRLAEPGDMSHADWSKAGYTSFDDCVAKNQDKEDPEAYCADIRRKLIGESLKETYDPEKTYVRLSRLEESVGQLIKARNNDIEALGKIIKAVTSIPQALREHALVESKIRVLQQKQILNELARISKDISEHLKKTSQYAEEISKHTKANLNNLATSHARLNKSFENLKETVSQLQQFINDKKYADDFKEFREQLEKLSEDFKGLKEDYSKIAEAAEKELQEIQKLKEQKEKELKETIELKKEVQTLYENQRAKLRGNFKAHAPPLKENQKDNTIIGDPEKELRESAKKKKKRKE